MRIAEAQLEAAEYQVQQAQANYRQVDESVKKTRIVAPISGVVTRLNVKEGEKVVGAIQMTGTEIMTIADLSVIEAVVDVVETDVVGIDVGDMAEIEVDALPNEKFRGVVSRIANSPKQAGMGTQDQLTNFEVRLRFLDPDVRFRPGMTATALITTQSRKNVVAVPIQAVTVDGQPGFWIEGAHFFSYFDRDGEMQSEQVRLAGNVLLWEPVTRTPRLEADLTMQEALRIAASVD